MALVGAGLLCLGLVTCSVPWEPVAETVSTARRSLTIGTGATTTLASPPAPTSRPKVPTATAPIVRKSDADEVLSWYEGCWELETEAVSFEIQLEGEGAELRGSFLLVKFCLLANELTACRIREGTLEGTPVAERMVEARITVPEYDDEGKVQLTLAPGEEALHWEEIEYPTQGLADPGWRYLPPSFDLVRCGS